MGYYCPKSAVYSKIPKIQIGKYHEKLALSFTYKLLFIYKEKFTYDKARNSHYIKGCIIFDTNSSGSSLLFTYKLLFIFTRKNSLMVRQECIKGTSHSTQIIVVRPYYLLTKKFIYGKARNSQYIRVHHIQHK